jgi:hypothetical protein
MTASWIGKHCARADPISRPAEAGLRVRHMDPRFFLRRTNEPVSRNETVEIDRLPVHLR